MEPADGLVLFFSNVGETERIKVQVLLENKKNEKLKKTKGHKNRRKGPLF